MECERAELGRAMRTRPHDDLPRLVYADWLEENGLIDESIFLRDFPGVVWYGDGGSSGDDDGGDGGYGGDGGDGGGGYGGYGDGGDGYGDGNSPQLITA